MSIIAYDLEVDENGQFVFVGGDLNIHNSNLEHASAIMDSNKGEWKQFPQVGINIRTYLNSPQENETLLESITQSQLKEDGFDIQDLKVTYNLRTSKLEIITSAIRIK